MYQKHRYTRHQNKKKPSRLLAVLAVIVAILTPFSLLKWSHHHKQTHIHQTLTLPKLRDHKNVERTVQNPWHIVKLKPGESLSVLFNRLNLSSKTLYAISHDTTHGKMLSNIKANQDIQILIKHQQLQKMILPISNIEYLVINKKGEKYQSKINKRKMNSHVHYITAVVNGSLYTTAKRNNIPVSLIQQMNEIFNWQINFARDGRQGDYFTIMYNAYYIDDKLVTTGDIQAVSYNNHGKLYQAVRYENKSGDAQYYTPQGLSLKKAFSRYPISFSHISSSFSLSRYHPLLHYRRPHKGVDLAASIGTPIHATGNGVIAMIGRQNGYGNMIKIKHDNTYETLYGHMLKFQKGLSRGSHVKRGDVIGYVGQSGLASGPHCHYEVHVRNQARNPTTVDLPRDSAVSRKEIARFKQTTNPLLAHLKLFEAAELASRHNKHNTLES